MIQCRFLGCWLMLGCIVFAVPLRAEMPLTVLVEVKPWPVVSRLIGFGGRLWFANSVKGRNHNSADIYSVDLEKSDVRYERHLFSQDAGRPVIADGLLYWPFEDARFSLGFGHFMVTDGNRWREGVIPTSRIFHTHAMAATDQLVAATSAWRARLNLSPDGGRTWRQVYDHPTPERRVSRIVDLATLGTQVFGSLTSRNQRGLMRFDGVSVEPVPGWPMGQRILALTASRDHVYGLVRKADGTTIWRTDGGSSEKVAGLHEIEGDDAGDVARDLIADENGLWLLTNGKTGGRVWRSEDGRTWNKRYAFSGGEAFELASYQSRIFAGGTNPKRGVGMLWGSNERRKIRAGDELGNLTDLASSASTSLSTSTSPTEIDWMAAGAKLDRLLAAPSTYQERGRKLRDLVRSLLAEDPPPGFFAQRLTSPMPGEPMSLIGGAVQIPAALMGRALVLFGMALQGEEAITQKFRIPITLLDEPWTRPPNRAEKYFDSQPFALWTVASTGQDDRATIDALIKRLDRTDDPLWLKGDIIGALTVLTDRRHAYDVAAWKQWWLATRPNWTSH